MPNLAETSNQKARTFPLQRGKSYSETLEALQKPIIGLTTPPKCKLAAIDEDDDLMKNDVGKPGDIEQNKRKESFDQKTNGKWKIELDESSKHLISKKKKAEKGGYVFNDTNVNGNHKVFDDRVAERDSGCIDCHGYRETTNYGLKPILKTRKPAITFDDREISEAISTDHAILQDDMNGRRIDSKKKTKEQPVSLPRSNGNVKSKINIYGARD
jgi:hypothetical protein